MTRLLIALSLGISFACSSGGFLDEPDAILFGTLERDRLELVAPASEPIVSVEVKPGEMVEQGQVLIRLDQRRLEARLTAAEARARQAEARVDELERGARSERRHQATARIQAARSELDQALLDRERIQSLVENGIAPRSDLDAVETRVETAEAHLEEAQATLDELVSGATTEELRQAQAVTNAIAAEIAELHVEGERLTLRAPVAGRVDAVPFEVGELPSIGESLIVLLSRDAPYARVYIPEPELPAFAVGTLVRVNADGLSESTDREFLEGWVRFVSREAVFTPHYALSERDRHRLAFVAEMELTGESADAAEHLPTGLPVWVEPALTTSASSGSP